VKGWSAVSSLRGRKEGGKITHQWASYGLAASLPKRRKQQSPDKLAFIARQRRLAPSGGLPPNIAQHFYQSAHLPLRTGG
jgi:hypothetical protein